MAIRQNLNFNMAGLGDEFFNKNAIIPKAAGSFILRRLKAFACLIIRPGDAHALAAAPGRGFYHHRITNLLRDFNRLFGIVDQAHISRHG